MADLHLGTVLDGAGPSHLDPDRLVRHAACFGMTGSGKTGLCVSLIEEVALAGVPVLALDPKGDLTNLALAFPGGRPADFAPWIEAAGTAERQERAEKASARWHRELSASGVEPERARRYASDVRVTVHTPGSSAGVPIDVLGVLGAPGPGLDEDGRAQLLSGTARSLLSLVGVVADPLRDPRHLVLARILELAWDAGEALDLERVIVRLVDPPFDKVGVFPVDDFLPRAKRLELAMALNTVVAAPSFRAWGRGTPLDLDLLLDASGGTPIRVFSLAHLDDAQRSFFCAMLLERTVAWARRQSGTSSLRALLVLDEAFGFLPPHPANPPTKRPLLTLLKQARAAGLGVVLSTQNPVDLDYKALSNTGVWWIGRLGTENDRERVEEGLTGLAGAEDAAARIAQLPGRAFAVRDVRERELGWLRSRWCLSFLRGPLTSAEIGRLPGAGQEIAEPEVEAAVEASPEPHGSPDPPPAPGGVAYRWLDPAAARAPRVAEHLGVPAASGAPGEICWRAALHVRLALRFDEGRTYAHEREEDWLYLDVDEGGLGDPVRLALVEGDLRTDPLAGTYLPLPAAMDEKRELAALRKAIVEDVFRGETDRMFKHAKLKLTSMGGEPREAYDARLAVAVKDAADAEIAKLRGKVEKTVERLETRRAKVERDCAKYEMQAKSRLATEVVSAGELLFGTLFGGSRKSVSGAMSRRGQTRLAQDRHAESEARRAELEREIYEAGLQLEEEVAEIEDRWAEELDRVEELEVRLEKNDIRVVSYGVVWIPS